MACLRLYLQSQTRLRASLHAIGLCAPRYLLLSMMVVVLMLAGCQPASKGDQPSANGYTQLLQGQGQNDAASTASSGFSQPAPGYTMQFPADHGEHPDYRIEWWYLTANLQDQQGQHYGVQFTLFRSALAPPALVPTDELAAGELAHNLRIAEGSGDGWGSRQLYMAHAALTTPTAHGHAEKFARGGVGLVEVSAAPFRLRIEQWQLASLAQDKRASSALLPLQLTVEDDQFALDLQISGRAEPALHGDAGFSQKHPRQTVGSYYYSLPHLQVSGTLQYQGDLADGTAAAPGAQPQTVTVSGVAWLDREWSSQYLSADQLGWDWLSLHLDDGNALMLFRLRQRDGDDYLYGSLIDAAGEVMALHGAQLSFIPTQWQQVQGKRLPLRWRVQVPALALDVEIAALHPHQYMDTTFAYWEGAVLCQPVSRCRGYLELTGY